MSSSPRMMCALPFAAAVTASRLVCVLGVMVPCLLWYQKFAASCACVALCRARIKSFRAPPNGFGTASHAALAIFLVVPQAPAPPLQQVHDPGDASVPPVGQTNPAPDLPPRRPVLVVGVEQRPRP